MNIPTHPQLITAATTPPNQEQLHDLLQQYPPKLAKYAYGTAGFRYDANVMESVMIRVTLFCMWYSLEKLADDDSMGIMITASHNDESYNGIKLVAPSGEMFPQQDQAELVEVVNTATFHPMMQSLFASSQNKNQIHLGYDTRKSSPILRELVLKVHSLVNNGTTIIDHGIVTTPILHHNVLHSNYQSYIPSRELIPLSPNTDGYYTILSQAYLAMLDTLPPPQKKSIKVLVDCACGVGYPSIQRIVEYIGKQQQQSQSQASSLFVPTNAPNDGPLNENCGSEHVQKQNQAPTLYNTSPSQVVGDDVDYCVSFDGDADRIVFWHSAQGQWILLDGDKIAVLICKFIKEQLLELLQQTTDDSKKLLEELKLGVVQTAYANGASTLYLKNVLGDDNIRIAKTGVQYVHAAAHEHFDIGVYFEANGHGTVLFSQKYYQVLQQISKSSTSSSGAALKRLQLLPQLINQAIGDALSDLLLVDCILRYNYFSKSSTTSILDSWISYYKDLPSKQTKVKVKDRTIIKTNANETECLEPAIVQVELQKRMDAVGNKARCFIRPSGTEDIVRVYAEASTTEDANQLAKDAMDIVTKYCNDDTTPNSRM